jgi:hypothetical protein
MKAAHFGLLLVIAMFQATPAEAASANAALRSACMADAKRLCGKVLRDPKARMACMRANRSKLSAPCQAAAAKRREQAIAACKKRLMPQVKGLGRDQARGKIRSCVMAEMQRR